MTSLRRRLRRLHADLQARPPIRLEDLQAGFSALPEEERTATLTLAVAEMEAWRAPTASDTNP